MNKKKIFVIVLNYNGWQDTVECVNSLCIIDTLNLDIVVVDNKSTDNSVEQLKSILNTRVVIIESEKNNGFSAGNNIGIKYALAHRADYVLLLNNDTLVEEDFLSPMVEFEENNLDCGCMSSRIYYNHDRKKIWFDGGNFNPYICRVKHYRFNTERNIVTGIHETGFVSGCCMLIPIRVVKEVGLMDEQYFMYVEDTEYSLRIKSAGYKLYWDADHSIYHKVSSSTKKISGLSQYYEIRNRLLLGKRYLTILHKVTSTMYNVFYYMHKIRTKRYQISVIKEAYIDYFHNRFGKKE